MGICLEVSPQGPALTFRENLHEMSNLVFWKRTVGHYSHQSSSGQASLFLQPNPFALRTFTLYFQSSLFQYLNFDISCLLFIFKTGQGQPMVTIWINLVGPEYPMLHTKFQGLRPFKSWEENFRRIFTIYGLGEYLDHVTLIPWTIFHSHIQQRLHM